MKEKNKESLESNNEDEDELEDQTYWPQFQIRPQDSKYPAKPKHDRKHESNDGLFIWFEIWPCGFTASTKQRNHNDTECDHVEGVDDCKWDNHS